jgi:ATP-dependent DNA ligase
LQESTLDNYSTHGKDGYGGDWLTIGSIRAAPLVTQIADTEWTKDGKLRHPAFLGLRDDKSAQDVHREVG